MERRESHTVDVIRSGSGVKVYSTIDHKGLSLKKGHEGYDSLEDAQNKITGDLRTMYGLSKLYGVLRPVEKAAFAILILKDVISNITSNHGDNDILPILGIMGIYVITSLANEMNTNSAVLAKHRLLTVKEAQKVSLPQFQQAFPLYPKEDSQQ